MLRRAVNRVDGVMAECPLGGGMCLTKELRRKGTAPGRAGDRPLSSSVVCGFYEGLHEDDRGKFARCDYPEPKAS
jgi:hypothetical protein